MYDWLKFFEMELERPDRTEWYLMRLMAVVDGLFARNAIDLNKYRVKFIKEGRPTQTDKSGPSLVEQQKKLWTSRVGGNVRIVNKKRSELSG